MSEVSLPGGAAPVIGDLEGRFPQLNAALRQDCEFLRVFGVLEAERVCLGFLLISLTVDIETQDPGMLPECRQL